MLASFTRALALLLVLVGAAANTHAEALSETVKLPFDLKTPYKLDIVLGPVRVNGGLSMWSCRRVAAKLASAGSRPWSRCKTKARTRTTCGSR